MAGVIGVTIGAEVARRWRVVNMQADALVCAFGMIGGIPFLFFTLYMFDKKTTLAWVSSVYLNMFFVVAVLLCLDNTGSFNSK